MFGSCFSGVHQSSPGLANSDSGYGSQLVLFSQQSGAAILDANADTDDCTLTPPPPIVEPLKDGRVNSKTTISEMYNHMV